ncbi:MAG TPA: hypothetical protein VF008_10810 [Niastella sp.]
MFKLYLKKSLSLFSIVGFLFIPLTFFGFDYQYRLTKFIFLTPVSFIQDHFFPHALKNIDFSSDTISLNILLALLLIISFLVVLILELFKIRSAGITPLFKFLSAYYLAAVFLKYGFDKVFKRQFYLPEPNILYSDFGHLTKDTLFWSTMGTSYMYSVSTGIIEILAGLLILFKRTRIAGFCVAMAVVINIFLINIGFDISVKVFTSFLLMVLVLNLYPALKIVYAFFIQHKQAQLSPALHHGIPVNKWVHVFLCAGIIGFILFPYISLGTFNDDHAKRPPLHGAYQIEQFMINNDTLNSCDFPFKRFFIHRNSYIIFQKEDETMVDYFFEMNSGRKQMDIRDYQNNKITVTYNYYEKEGALQLIFGNNAKWIIQSRSLNWKALPALQDDMHYTIDEIK